MEGHYKVAMKESRFDGVVQLNRKRRTAESSVRRQRKTRCVCVLGSTKSGKSALINRFLDNSYTEEYMPTIEECFNRDYNYKGFDLNLDVIDTCGPYMFPIMRDISIRKADIVIATYEINNKKSIKEAVAVCFKVREIRDEVIPIVLAGCKSDLVNEVEDIEMNKDFESLQDVKLKHVLTSAKDNINITDAFEMGFEDVIARIHKQSMTARQYYVRKMKTERKELKKIKKKQRRCLIM